MTGKQKKDANDFEESEANQAVGNEPLDEPVTAGDQSGWMYLTSFESVNKMVDALLDLPPRKEFNKKELAELADVSRNSVGNHINRLVELNIIETVSNTSPTRYRLNIDSNITELLIKLDGELTTLVQDQE